MNATPDDLYRWRVIARVTRNLRAVLQSKRPALLEVDGAVDDAIAAADELLSGVVAVLHGLDRDLRTQDEREAGDRDDISPLPMPRPGS